MKNLHIQSRTLFFTAVLLALVSFVVCFSLCPGSFTSVAVMVTTVENRAITPLLYGIGTIEVRYAYKIVPASAVLVNRLGEQREDKMPTSGQMIDAVGQSDLSSPTRARERAFARLKREAIEARQNNIHLITPIDCLVSMRTDQIHKRGMSSNLSSRIVLYSQASELRGGRIPSLADAGIEETLARVVLDQIPESLSPAGEMAKITVALQALPAGPVIPDEAITYLNGRLGVWRITDGDLCFIPVSLGAVDRDGYVQVREGLNAGDQVVTYSTKALTARSRFHIVDRIPEGTADRQKMDTGSDSNYKSDDPQIRNPEYYQPPQRKEKKQENHIIFRPAALPSNYQRS